VDPVEQVELRLEGVLLEEFLEKNDLFGIFSTPATCFEGACSLDVGDAAVEGADEVLFLLAIVDTHQLNNCLNDFEIVINFVTRGNSY
jgi:hypothetical protein